MNLSEYIFNYSQKNQEIYPFYLFTWNNSIDIGAHSTIYDNRYGF